MKITKRLLAIILCGVSLISFACSGSSSPDTDNQADSGNRQNAEFYQVDPSKATADTRNFYDYEGVHQYNVTDSTVKLVENGHSEYVIVIPEESSTQIISAANYLKEYFYEATGISLLVKRDGSTTVNDTKIISIGKTIQSVLSGITAGDVDLGSSGYIIKTVGDDVFLFGDSYGSLYSVFEFLAWQFNFDMFSVGAFTIDRNVTDMYLKNFDILDIPDIEYRLGGATNLGSHPAFREIGLGEPFVGAFDQDGSYGVAPFHNWLHFIPRGVYGADHPEWFSPDGSQLCLTRDFDGLLAEVTSRCIEMFMKYPGKYSITFTQMDGGGWCTHCKQAYQEYIQGREEEEMEGDGIINVHASYGEKEYHCVNSLRFTNELAKNIKAWAANYDPEHEYYVYMFRYGMIGDPPVKTDGKGNPITDAEGNYISAIDDIEISDNLCVLYCYTYDLYYDGVYNDLTKLRDGIKRWKTVTDKFMTWIYSTHFQNYLAPYNYLQVMQEDYQTCVWAGSKIMFDNGQYNMTGNSDWGVLKSYLKSKLAWNVNADVPALIEKFFDGYFLDAAPIMKDLYRDYVDYHNWLGVERMVGLKRNTQDDQVTQENYPYATVRAYLDKLNSAIDSIRHLKVNDPELYNKIYDRIQLESLSYRWIEIHLYPDKYEYGQLAVMKEQLIADCKKYGVTQFKETAGIEAMV